MQTNLTGDCHTPMAKYGIGDVLAEIRLKSLSEKQKGTDFERLMKLWFQTDPRYNFFTDVWLWEEFPARKDLGGKDLGIDLVAKSDIGDYYAIQCKCYAEDATINKAAIDSFLSNASRTFVDPDTLTIQEFSQLIWVQTSRKAWGNNANDAIQGLSKGFNRISLYDLENSPVDWHKLKMGLYGENARLNGKQPRPHQLDAMSDAYKHFCEKGNERGKLVMACGTGKTYTSLKIMEQITDSNALVLFLVPSIALLGQSLNAWMSDKQDEIKAICVCSDSKVTRKQNENEDDYDTAVVDLAVPATTDYKPILRQLKKYGKMDCRTVIFSTYQSIEAVKVALDNYGKELDLIICDEAHRTTGVIWKDHDESNFTKVHNNDFIRARRRMYMTATPRLYSDSVKVKAKQNDDVLCSMDDENVYGQEFHRLSFNDAVRKGLLTDYKVLVLTVSENDIPAAIRNKIKTQYKSASDKVKELQFDDATKLIGCINGLSKRVRGDKGVTREQDPLKMKRAVAFCQTINPTKKNPKFTSTQIARYFPEVCKEYKESLPEEERKEVVNIQSQHIDGSMDTNTRNKLIAWLKTDADDEDECRVLCNVRCLSEGVDVPALDAVLFLSPRNSEVEVVQSVGRVMRSFGKGTDHEKKYGYIIIPVIVPNDVSPEDALRDNERFRVVWQILQALRSHDENFNAHVNQISLNTNRPPKITVAGVPAVPHGTYTIGDEESSMAREDDGAVNYSNEQVAQQLEILFGELQDGIYARIVEKVGDRMYWENWAKFIGEIAKKFIERITSLIKENESAHHHFDEFVQGLHRNINESVDAGQAIEMLAQHMIIRPVFDALFKDYQFVNNNAVSSSMQKMIELLETEGLEMETAVLDKFYVSVRNNVSNIDNLEGKQTIIKNLYEKFFKGAFPKTVEKLGIVYTPVECVDFIIHSVNDILQSEFNSSLSDENVHILDPFTGTGTFITRLLQSGLIRKEDMLRKYKEEIHCNEIVLLAYYVADVNIESVYHDLMHPDKYEMYDGICLTDTFQLNEHGDNDIFSKLFPENSERVLKQKKAPVRVIIGNPPYSVGQKSANDNAQNLKYEKLDNRIATTYALKTAATNKNSLYDTYIKAFRWASDRIASCKDGGIVAFISNGAWIDGNAHDGLRRCLEDEYSSIYVLNLRGNQRTSGELSRKEGGKIFGSGSRTPITITFLVKNPNKTGKANIYYHDIGDYLTREQKLKMVKDFRSIDGIEWKQIQPNDKHDWINQRDGVFDTLVLLGDKSNKNNKQTFFVPYYSNGAKTNRDVWVCNYCKEELINNVKRSITFFNSESDRYASSDHSIAVEDFINTDETKISWSRAFRYDIGKNRKYLYKENALGYTMYRPYCKLNTYFDRQLTNDVALLPLLFPSISLEQENLVICVPGLGSSKEYSAIITDTLPDLGLNAACQCFPLYWYEENKNRELTLFDAVSDEKYIRRDGITDWILKEVRSRYGNAKNITKEMIFYYVYGLLHSKEYRERFADDLKKSLPRIPIVDRVEDFMDFYQYGRKLAELHLNYETIAPHPDVKVNVVSAKSPTQDEYDYYRVDKLRFMSKEDKSVIIYNNNIRIENIPAKAYDYIVNGKSAIDWIVERYCINIDKNSGIRNDANDWAREHNKPRYILDLLLSVINVSTQTVDIVNLLPHINF